MTEEQELEYTAQVLDSLDKQGMRVALSRKEFELCMIAIRLKIGPYDCTAQIIADRQDKKDRS